MRDKQRATKRRNRVLRAAVAVADAEGIEGLSMRRLARKLGMGAMTLYTYVASKDDLFQGMADLVAEEVVLPSAELHWKAATRTRAISAHDALVRHRWASELWIRVLVGPARIRYMDAGLRAFREAGFSPALTEQAFHAVENHIIGYTIQQLGLTVKPEEVAEAAAGFLRTLDTDSVPYLAEHVQQHIDAGTHEEGNFEFTLDVLLDGFERLLEAENARRGGPRPA